MGTQLDPAAASTIESGSDSPTSAPTRPTLGDFSQRYAGVVVAVALFAMFAILRPDTFLSYNNVVSIIANGAIAGLISLGLLFPLAAGVFDISVSGMMTISIIGVTWLFQETTGHMPILLAVVIVLAGGVIVGLVNSFFILKLRIDPFITTIGTSSVLLGLSQMISGGNTITQHIPESFTTLGRSSYLRIPLAVYVFVVVALIAWYFLEFHPYGRMLYATGASREASRLAGVNTTRIITQAFVASAVLATLAGIVLAARLGNGPPNLGNNYLLTAYSQAFLGSTIIVPGRFNVLGLVVAVLIINIGVNGFLLLGAPFYVVPLFLGVALLAAVTLGSLERRRKAPRTPAAAATA